MLGRTGEEKKTKERYLQGRRGDLVSSPVPSGGQGLNCPPRKGGRSAKGKVLSPERRKEGRKGARLSKETGLFEQRGRW